MKAKLLTITFLVACILATAALAQNAPADKCEIKIQKKEDIKNAFPDGIRVKVGENGFLFDSASDSETYKSTVRPIGVNCTISANTASPNAGSVRRFKPFEKTKDASGKEVVSGTRDMILKVRKVEVVYGSEPVPGRQDQQDDEDFEGVQRNVSNQMFDIEFAFYQEDGKTLHPELATWSCRGWLRGEDQLSRGLTIGYLLAAMAHREGDTRKAFDFSESGLKCLEPGPARIVDVAKGKQPGRAENRDTVKQARPRQSGAGRKSVPAPSTQSESGI